MAAQPVENRGVVDAEFRARIRSWVAKEQEATALLKQLQDVRRERKTLEEGILHALRVHGMEKAVLNVAEGQIHCVDRSATPALSLTMLAALLPRFFARAKLPDQTSGILAFIKTDRPRERAWDLELKPRLAVQAPAVP